MLLAQLLPAFASVSITPGAFSNPAGKSMRDRARFVDGIVPEVLGGPNPGTPCLHDLVANVANGLTPTLSGDRFPVDDKAECVAPALPSCAQTHCATSVRAG